MKKIIILFACLIFIPRISSAEEFIFSNSMLEMNGISNADTINGDGSFFPEGNYTVDVYLNGKFLSQREMMFRKKGKKLSPLFPKSLVESLSLRDKRCLHKKNVPISLEACIPSARVETDLSSLRINVTVPQSLMEQKPAGYIPVSEFDPGIVTLFSNYTVNQYVSHTSGSGSDSSTYLGLNSGLNLGMWQFRQQGNFNRNQKRSQWQSSRMFVQRALPFARSEFSAGQLSSSAETFSSLSYNGISLKSDNRMLPSSVSQYAPVVRGNARTNARVEIFQKKNKIYETTAPPGSFKIDTLSPVSYGGDLRVIVTENTGEVSEYTVPYSVLPGSVRPGQFNYSFSTGRLRDYAHDNQFAELGSSFGFSNLVTGNGGLRVGKGYKALNGGGVYSSALGAIGSGVTWSDARLNNGSHSQGWMFDASYSKSIDPTNTVISFAGYRYSTRGYRDLQDIVALNNSDRPPDAAEGGSYQQKNRLQATISQSLNTLGNVYLSGSSQTYYDGRTRDSSWQAGYSKTLMRGINVDFSLSRQYQMRINRDDNPFSRRDERKKEYFKETQFALNVSIPLGRSAYSGNLNTSYVHDSSGQSYQTSLSGTAGDDNDVQWGVNYSRSQLGNNTYGGNLSTSLPKARVSTTVSRSGKNIQGSLSANGAVAVHSGGVTFGQSIGDTFALVEARGAEGARVMNTQDVRVDGTGFAIIPGLMPYRTNTISLDAPDEIGTDVDILDSQRIVVPYAGAAVKVRFKTRRGIPVMMQVKREDGSYVPLGSDITDDSGSSVATVSQAGNAYLRLQNGTPLTAHWSQSKADSCEIKYPPVQANPDKVLIYVSATCH